MVADPKAVFESRLALPPRQRRFLGQVLPQAVAGLQVGGRLTNVSDVKAGSGRDYEPFHLIPLSRTRRLVRYGTRLANSRLINYLTFVCLWLGRRAKSREAEHCSQLLFLGWYLYCCSPSFNFLLVSCQVEFRVFNPAV